MTDERKEAAGPDTSSFRTNDYPPSNIQVEILCEYGSSTFVAPFKCFYRGDEKWVGVSGGRSVTEKVLGWRIPI